MHSHEAPGLVWFVFAWVPVLLVVLTGLLLPREEEEDPTMEEEDRE